MSITCPIVSLSHHSISSHGLQRIEGSMNMIHRSLHVLSVHLRERQGEERMCLEGRRSSEMLPNNNHSKSDDVWERQHAPRFCKKRIRDTTEVTVLG